MSRTTYNHAHKYRAVNGQLKVYKCQYSGCPHSVNAVMAVGRSCECPDCGQEIIITEEHLRRVTIKCIGGCKAQTAAEPEMVSPTNDKLQNLLGRLRK